VSHGHAAPAFHKLNLLLVYFHDSAVRIGSAGIPYNKAIREEATWKWFPMPVIGLPCGTTYRNSFRSAYISSRLRGLGIFVPSVRSHSRYANASDRDPFRTTVRRNLSGHIMTHTVAASSSPLKYSSEQRRASSYVYVFFLIRSVFYGFFISVMVV